MASEALEDTGTASLRGPPTPLEATGEGDHLGCQQGDAHGNGCLPSTLSLSGAVDWK